MKKTISDEIKHCGQLKVGEKGKKTLLTFTLNWECTMDGLKWNIIETYDKKEELIFHGYYKYKGWNRFEPVQSNGYPDVWIQDWYTVRSLLDYLYFYMGSKMAWGDGVPFFENLKKNNIDVEQFNLD